MYNSRFSSTLSALALTASVLIGACSKPSEDIYDPTKDKKTEITGTIKFSDGSPAEGVVVSDGYTCCPTDKDGKYALKRNSSAYYVMYSIPENAEINIGSTGIPTFFTKITSAKTVYDFTLKKKTKDTKVRIIGLGDIQVDTDVEVRRFREETAADMKSYIASKKNDMTTIAIHLGDLVFNKWDFYSSIMPEVTVDKLGVPLFFVIGNHDHEFVTSGDYEAQKKYEAAVGPVNFSFNIGDFHVLCLDDINHVAKESAVYDYGFHDWQYEWIKADLSYVSKDKSLIIAVHCPFKDSFANSNFGEHTYHDEALKLFAEFKSASIYAGHYHTLNTTFKHNINGKNIQEYVCASPGGGSWMSTICDDGTPYGYNIFEYEGTELKNNYYKPTKYEDTFQIRMYKASDFPPITAGGTKYSWGISSLTNRIMVNVFGYIDGWTFEVYENGVNSGTLTKVNSIDMWGFTYFNTALSKTNYCTTKSAHMFYYTLKDTSCTNVRVVGHDIYGNTFECTKFTTASESDWPNTYR